MGLGFSGLTLVECPAWEPLNREQKLGAAQFLCKKAT